MTPQRPASTHLRRRPPASRVPRLAVDLRQALGLTGIPRQVPQPLGPRAGGRRALVSASRPGRSSPPARSRSPPASGSSASAPARAGLGFREGYLVVALTWLLAAVFGAIPYVLSGERAARRAGRRLLRVDVGLLDDGRHDPHQRRRRRPLAAPVAPVHAVARRDGDHRPRPRRAPPAPRRRAGSCSTRRWPGPETDPLADRIRTTARRLWLLYIALTAVLAGRARRSSASSGSTIGWGSSRASRSRSRRCRPGASCPRRRSLAGFAAASQWVVVVFMVLAGINFALVYRALVRRRWRSAGKDQELRLYLGILTVASVALVAEIWADGLADGEAAVRHGVFQVVSITTTTGFASTDFASWATFGLMLLLGADVRRRLRGLDGQLGEGRPPPPRRPVATARAAPDPAPGGGDARAAQRPRRAGEDAARRGRVRPALHRPVRDRRRRRRDRHGDPGPLDLDDRRDRRRGDDARQRRPGPRRGRPVRLVRELPRRLQADPHRR